MKIIDTIVAADFPGPIEVKPGYDDFFNNIMKIVGNGRIDDELGENLRRHTLTFLQTCDFSNFNTFSNKLYRRVHIGKDFKSGWEVVVTCWKKGNRTSIHGHPEFASFNFAEGKFLVEIFRERYENVVLGNVFEAQEGDGLYSIGKKGLFNNHIHRITCLSDIGYSLNIYSDDARKGRKYTCSSHN